MEERINFDFNEVLEQLNNCKNLTCKDGLLAPLIKQLTELESHIANDVFFRTRNKNKKEAKESFKDIQKIYGLKSDRKVY